MSTLLVSSTGGHLKELHYLHRRLSGVEGPFRWVTFDTPQSRSLLDGEDVEFVPFVGGRDPLNVARNFVSARRILRDRDWIPPSARVPQSHFRSLDWRALDGSAATT